MTKGDFDTPITQELKAVYFWETWVIHCFAVLGPTNLHELQ